MPDYEYEDTIENIKEGLETIKGFYTLEKFKGDAMIIGGIDFTIFNRYAEDWDTATLYITVKNGYYQGVMIDVDDEEIEEFQPCKTKLAEIVRAKNKIKKILSSYTLPVKRVATFSNGEAIYEEVK